MSEHPTPSSARPPQVQLKVDSHPANLAIVRRAIEAFATRQGFAESAVAEIGLCVNEAMANVIRHAYDGRVDRPVHLSATFADGRLTVTLRDWGSGVDPRTLPRRERDPLTPGGVGMICLRHWMDDVSYQPQPDGGMLTTLVRRKAC